MDDGVEYREIYGFPDYRVGNDGSVWTRKLKGSNLGSIGDWYRMKSYRTSKFGHQFVALSIRGTKAKQLLVHRLVLSAFVGPCPDGMQCCHNDGNPLNNKLENLRWGTAKDNRADTLIHGTRNHGEKHGMARLTEEIVRSIRHDFNCGASLSELSSKYSISKANACLIVNRKAWTHI